MYRLIAVIFLNGASLVNTAQPGIETNITPASAYSAPIASLGGDIFSGLLFHVDYLSFS